MCFAVLRLLDEAGRDRLPAQLVVDDRGDADLLAGDDVLADVGLERRVAALVLGDLRRRSPRRPPDASRRRSAGRSARRPTPRGRGRASGTRRRRRGRVPPDRRRDRCSWRERRPHAGWGAGRSTTRRPDQRPPHRSAKRQRPSSDLRSRVAVSWGRSIPSSSSRRQAPSGSVRNPRRSRRPPLHGAGRGPRGSRRSRRRTGSDCWQNLWPSQDVNPRLRPHRDRHVGSHRCHAAARWLPAATRSRP